MKFDEYTLEEVTEKIFSGGTPKTKESEYWNGKYNWLSSGETRKDFIKDTEKYITESGIKNSSTKLAKSNDVVIASAGQGHTRGQTSYLLIDTYINQSIIALRANTSILNPLYLYYNLSSRYSELRSISDSHSSRGSLTTKLLKELKMKLPSLVEQKKVTKLLYCIDKKIKVNNSLISNLEELAQTLFKRWFVDFEFPNEEGKPYKSSGGKMVESELGVIPEGWDVTNIQSMPVIISDHVANGSFASIKKNVQIVEDEDYALFLRNTDLKQDLQGERRYVTKSSYDFLKKTQLFGGEVIISNVGDVGTIHRCPSLNRPMVLGNNLIVIQPTEQNEMLNTYFYFLFKSFEGKKLIKSITSGSVQMKFNKTDFRNMKIVIPESFEKMNMNILKKILLKVDLLKQEIESLSNLRDTLLPKLLSGEIELPDDMEVTDDVPIS
ncbi:MAG TPA: restriction endonuclease subunit S [Pseudogracilibacillus sp.]|nr:restriction endonuclease subunit S [Pseudogracilibacillus sp.]